MFALKLPSQIKVGSSQTAYVAARKDEMLAKQQAEAKAAIAPSPDEKIASPITKAAIAAAAAQRLQVQSSADEWSSVRTVAGAKAGDDSKDAAPDSSQRPAAAVAAAASPPPPPPPQEAAPPSPAKPLSWAEMAKKNAPPPPPSVAAEAGTASADVEPGAAAQVSICCCACSRPRLRPLRESSLTTPERVPLPMT